ncbi:MAG: 30S ribosomal protein S26e [Candidatus Heimdallarchaeota archaeon]
MGKKRKSRGRTKGKKGRSSMVQCTSCGQMVPRDKAKKKTRYSSLVDPVLGRELRQRGSYIPRERRIVYYCVSCAVHRGLVRIRSKTERKD